MINTYPHSSMHDMNLDYVLKVSKQAEKDHFFCKQKTAYEISTRDWSSDVCSSDLSAIVVTKLKSLEPIGV